MTRWAWIKRFYWRYHVEVGFAILLVAVLFIAAGLRVNTTEIDRQARLGAESHRWACAYQDDLQRRIMDGRRFLSETPLERVEQYGPALGKTPPSVVRATLANEEQVLATTKGLHC